VEVTVDRLGHVDLGGVLRLPRSLHYATRRTDTVRGKKPGRFGRDDSVMAGLYVGPKGPTR